MQRSCKVEISTRLEDHFCQVSLSPSISLSLSLSLSLPLSLPPSLSLSLSLSPSLRFSLSPLSLRLHVPDVPTRVNNLFRRGSRFRYSGRTLRQTMDGEVKSQHDFQRSEVTPLVYLLFTLLFVCLFVCLQIPQYEGAEDVVRKLRPTLHPIPRLVPSKGWGRSHRCPATTTGTAHSADLRRERGKQLPRPHTSINRHYL